MNSNYIFNKDRDQYRESSWASLKLFDYFHPKLPIILDILFLHIEIILTSSFAMQIGSHYHFIEVNPYLVFDRRRAYGMRLNISAGTATRFEVITLCIWFV